MIVVIQCAAKKNPDAGYLRADDGRNVLFVADPDSAPASKTVAYARPDDVSDGGKLWRQQLVQYNKTPEDNPLGLLPAWQLYANGTYEMLVTQFGAERLYILSAGWGLIAADFLTPAYDITFSAGAEKYKRRRKSDNYNDLEMLASTGCEPVVFLGGKDYVSLFCKLTQLIKVPKIIFYNSASPPYAPECTLKRFITRTRTNWHYECAKAFNAGEITV